MRLVSREAISKFLERARTLFSFRRSRIFGLLILVGLVVGVSVFFPHGVLAVETTELVTKWFWGLVATALSYVVTFEGWLIAILVDVLVVFASYNGFATALPVQYGWVLIRDLVNMFFIVVLLVSAFATIIGYDTASFHYSRVLPKLLLMAILINFSKTIIQLAVDFSQVLMLTFVNAFRSAAAGNFIQMFGLTTMLQLRNAPDGSVTAIDYAQIVPSYILAIILLSIVISVLIIIVGFLIVRIVGLWVLIMFSPAAFFVQAVPARLKKGLSSLADDYWAKLGTLLAGGPVMAFFIWLSLAMTQSGGAAPLAETLQVYTPQSTVGRLTGFMTEVGTAPQIASFIIAVALMMIGLDTAVKSASSVSSAFGSLARKITPMFALATTAALTRRTAGAAGRAARTGARIGFAGAKLGGKAAIAGYGLVDRRADLTGKAAKAASAIPIGKLPIVGGRYRDLVGKGMTFRKKEREADAAKMAKITEGMSYEDKGKFVRNQFSGSFLSEPAGKLAMAKQLADLTSQDSVVKAQKERIKKYETEIEATHRKNGTIDANDTGEVLAEKLRAVKREALGKAKYEVDAEAAKNMSEAKKLLTGINAKEQLAEIGKEIDKNPHYLQGDDYKNLMASISVDPEKRKNLSAGAISRADVLMSLMGESVIRRDASGKFNGVDQAGFEHFLDENKDNKFLVANAKTLVEHLRESPGVNLAEVERGVIQTDAEGKIRVYDGPSGAVAYSEKEKEAREGVQKYAHDRSGAGTLTADADSAWKSGLFHGLSISDIRPKMNKNAAGVDDGAFDAALANDVGLLSTAAANATDAASFSKAFLTLAQTLQSLPSVSDSAFQMKVLAPMGDDGAAAIGRATYGSDSNQRKAAVSLVRVYVRRSEEINRNGGPKTADEREILRITSEIKKHLPSSKEEYANNNAGVPPGGRRYGGAAYQSTPAAMRMVLREGEAT